VTHLVAGVGTGGTLGGAARSLRELRPDLVVVGADPEGSLLSGDTVRPYLTEGVGEDFIPGTHSPELIDRWVRVSDGDAFAAARRLTREEGILSGESCGTALVAALTVARELTAQDGGSAAVVVVILPDTGRNYLSKLYDDEWMRKTGLLGWEAGRARVATVLERAHHPGAHDGSVILARTTDLVATAIDTLERHAISQMPVSERDDDAIDGIVGSLSERSLLERAYRDPSVVERTVGEVMERPLPTIDAAASLDDAFLALSEGAPALVAVRGGRPAGIVTKLDLLEYLAHRGSGREG
jgi:cystathionine beta-synthase